MRTIATGLTLAVFMIVAPQPGQAQRSFPEGPQPPILIPPPEPRVWRASLATGFEYDSGIAGDTNQLFVPVSARFEYGAFAIGIATSMVSVDGMRSAGGYSIDSIPEDLIETALDFFNKTEGSDLALEDIADLSLNETGVGDTVISASYAWFQPDSWLPFIEFTSSVKIPTGSTRDQIGTGKYDWIIQLDLAKQFGRFTPFATIAYRFNGGPIVLREQQVRITRQAVIDATAAHTLLLEEAKIRVDDTLQLAIGSSLRVTDRLTRIGNRDVAFHAGLIYDFQQSPFKGIEDDHEIVSYLTFELSRNVQIGPYFVVGLSDSAPDWGIATQLLLTY